MGARLLLLCLCAGALAAGQSQPLRIKLRPLVKTYHLDAAKRQAACGDWCRVEFKACNAMDRPVDFVWEPCAYFIHWSADNGKVAPERWTCRRNLPPQRKELGPRECFTGTVPIKVARDARPGRLRFRLRFEPGVLFYSDGRKRFLEPLEPSWSSPVEIRVAE